MSPFTFLASSAMVASCSLFWIGSVDSNLSLFTRLGTGIAALLGSTILYFDQGTRSILIMALAPGTVFKLITIWRRSRFRAFAFLIVVVIIAYFVLQFQVLYRARFSRLNLPELFFENWLTLGGTIDFFKETLLAVSLVPAYHDYFNESVLVQFLVSPIPRFIWADKPASQLVWFYTYFRWNIDIYSRAGNVLPGIVGQYYMSWGWFGPIMIGGVLGSLTKRIDSFLSGIDIRNDPYTFGLGIMLSAWVFICYRLLSPVFFYPVVISAIIIFLSKRMRVRQ